MAQIAATPNDEFLSDLLKASEHILYRIDLVRGGYDYISPIALEIFGVSSEVLYERGLDFLLNELFDPVERVRFTRHIMDLCRNSPGQSIRTRLECRLKNKRGEEFWHQNSMTLVSSPEGKPLLASGISVDVTARRRSELALRESEEKYRATMNAVPVGVFVAQDFRFHFANPRMCEMFGYSLDEFTRRLGALDLVPPEQQGKLSEEIGRCAVGEAGEPYELIGVRKDGSQFPALVLWQPSVLNGRPASVGTVIDLSSQRRAEQALVDSTHRYSVLFEGALDAIVVADAESGRIIDANVAAEILLKRPHEEMIGMHHSAFREESCEIFEEHVLNGREGVEETEIIDADGERVAVEISSNTIETASGQKLSQCVIRDIRQRKHDEMELKRAALVFETSQELILLTDADCRIISVNQVFEEMTGYTPDEVIGQNPRLLSSGRHTPEFYAAMWQAIGSRGKWQGEVWNRRKSGDVFPVWLTISAYRDAQGKVLNYVGVSSDISEHVAAQERIRQLAYFDSLTHLPNRRLLQDRAEQALASAEREGKQVALLFVDLDHFKTINDSLGHSMGDRVLTEVSQRLQSCVRRMDTVARLGGDEFVVLLTDVTIEGATEVARKLIRRVARPYQIENHELGVTPSLGISVFPQDGRDFEALLKHADTAMYRAKESGRNGYQFFASEMNVAALERLMLENSLRQGIERGEFVLHYQPQIDLASGRIVGAEALVRWRHPQLGLVPPGKFIPVAEVSGLIVMIGEWVLGEACRQNRAWEQAGLPAVSVAVNISAVQYRSGRNEAIVATVLADTGLAPELLELELTEGIVMVGADATVATLQRISDMGVKLAIDDFGTGYSSLSYLKRFPIDRLKIDQSFVRDIVTDTDDWAISSAIISMGHSLRLQVIAEGVEYAEQLEMLRRQGCDEVQGYYFSVPLPADDFAVLLRQQKFLVKD